MEQRNSVLEQLEQIAREWKPVKTVFARVNGRGVCVDFTTEQLEEIATVDNLVSVLRDHFDTDDVIFEGFGEF